MVARTSCLSSGPRICIKPKLLVKGKSRQRSVLGYFIMLIFAILQGGIVWRLFGSQHHITYTLCGPRVLQQDPCGHNSYRDATLLLSVISGALIQTRLDASESISSPRRCGKDRRCELFNIVITTDGVVCKQGRCGCYTTYATEKASL